MANNAAEYFDRLTTILAEYGFEWVVDQAETEIAEGRSLTKEVQAPEYGEPSESDGFAMRAPRRRRTALMTTEPWDVVKIRAALYHLWHALVAPACQEQ